MELPAQGREHLSSLSAVHKAPMSALPSTFMGISLTYKMKCYARLQNPSQCVYNAITPRAL